MNSISPPIRLAASIGPAAGEAQAAGYRIWFDRPGRFSTHTVQALRHNYHEHPLLQLDRLATLAKRLNETRQCRFIAPGATQASSFDLHNTEQADRSIDDIFRRIEEPGSWIALYNVETDPAYKAFLQEVVGHMRPLVEREQPGIFDVGGFIFISAPPSVTPFHIDRENNFWLQVRGRKVMNVWRPDDRCVVAARDRDEFVVYGKLTNVRLREGYRERSHQFDVGPGDGVYFPSTSPHMTRSDAGWVRPGDGVAVSIGVVFYTDATRRAANVHALNLFLRNRGWSPRDVGESDRLDRLKYPFGRALVALASVLRGYRRRVGF